MSNTIQKLAIYTGLASSAAGIFFSLAAKSVRSKFDQCVDKEFNNSISEMAEITIITLNKAELDKCDPLGQKADQFDSIALIAGCTVAISAAIVIGPWIIKKLSAMQLPKVGVPTCCRIAENPNPQNPVQTIKQPNPNSSSVAQRSKGKNKNLSKPRVPDLSPVVTNKPTGKVERNADGQRSEPLPLQKEWTKRRSAVLSNRA